MIIIDHIHNIDH